MQKVLTKSQVRKFRSQVYRFYAANKRVLPWRRTKNLYRIIVSEIMLQQTQVDRVTEYYTTFIKQFPTVQVLAQAPFSEVFKIWQGLGYNRRAKYLHNTAKKIVSEYKGRFPKSTEELRTFPGVGPYTAAAVCAFAYNQPMVFIETNIRTVFIHEFFQPPSNSPLIKGGGKGGIHDKDIIPLIEQTLDYESPREWYNALMDYGTHLKKVHPNPNRKSKHHTKQKPFKGSDREIRGVVLKLLTTHHALSVNTIVRLSGFEKERALYNISNLEKEGLIQKKQKRYSIKEQLYVKYKDKRENTFT